ncbi:MAG: tetratricopeptide repeat protein, partial [Planctomycetales bacterium]|nr:tetratricopeptide repeat protein [Planctomycetales bacterium]
MVQAVAEAERHFESLGSKETPEAVKAMQSVVACKRAFVAHLTEQKDAETAESMRREVRSLARSAAWLAALHEKRQEFEEGQAEWAGLADCCKQALGVNCSEYWDAAQEAHALARLAKADKSNVREYLENRSEIKNAVRQRELDTAQTLAENDHTLCAKIFGELVPRTISSREFAAKVAFSRRQYDVAFKLFEKAMEQRRELYPTWHPTLAESTLDLGKRFEAAGRLDRALQLYDEVFLESSRSLGENHPLRGLAGVQSGEIYRGLGKYEQALNRLSTCVQIWKANSNKTELANCLNSIALAQQLSGEYDAAESSYLEAAELLAGDGHGREVALRLATEANYASLLEETSRFPEALKIYERIVGARPADGPMSSADLIARENLARLYQSVGELAKAETMLDSLLQYRQRPPHEIARLHSMRGRFYLQLRALDKADAELNTALELLRAAANNTPGDVATVQSLQALVLLERGEHAEALAQYERVLKSLIESFGPKHVRCAEVYDQIAKVQRMLGRYSDATASHIKAIGIYEAAYGAGHEAVAWAQHRLGTTHFVFNSPTEARDAWRRSFEIKQAICHEVLPWLPEAQAAAFLTSLTTNDSSAGLDALLSTLIVNEVESAEEAFQCVWRSRGLVLNAIAHRERQLADTKRSPERAQLAEIRRRLAQLSIHAGSDDDAHRAARAEMLRELNEKKESLERIVAEQAQSAPTGDDDATQLSGIAPDVLMGLLPPQLALVQIVRTERWQPTKHDATEVFKKAVYDAFVVSPISEGAEGSVARWDVQWVELGDAAPIDDHIAKWRSAILRREGGTRGKRLGSKQPKSDDNSEDVSRDFLRRQVWEPISTALGGRSRVVIVPDGNFHRMPWIALPGAQKDYLIEEVQITTAADGRQLARLLQQQRAATKTQLDNFLLIGGVEYNAELPMPKEGQARQARETTWPLLEGTREEVAAISKVVPSAQTQQLLGEHALEAAVKSELERAAV